MNKRIKELESQCWEARQYGPPWFDSGKFAELLVKECASMCDPEPGLKYSPNAQSSREDCKEKILRLIG